MTVEEALELRSIAREKGIPFALAHTYSGHYTLKAMRCLVLSGVLGKLRRLEASYLQDWQRVNLGIQQEHRQDPAKSGDFNCNGDINTHNEFALRYVTGMRPDAVSCHTSIYGPDRTLDDDVDTFLWYPNGSRANSKASQIANGHENDHRVAVYAEHGGVKWAQENAKHLLVSFGDLLPEMTVQRGGIDKLVNALSTAEVHEVCGKEAVDKFIELTDAIEWATSLPTGHGHDFIDALVNHHHEFGRWVCDWIAGGKAEVSSEGYDVPTIDDGVEGMEFLAACKTSADGGGVSTEITRH